MKNDITITTRIPGTTVGAAPFFQGTAILHVMSNAIRVLEPGSSSILYQILTISADLLMPCCIHTLDGMERQIIKDLDNNMARPKIRYCSISDPFVLIIREDDSLGLFIGETERGKIRRKDMSPMGEKVSPHAFMTPLRRTAIDKLQQTSRYIAGGFYADTSEIFQSKANAEGSEKASTGTLQAAMNAGNNTQWLLLCRPQGVMEVMFNACANQTRTDRRS